MRVPLCAFALFVSTACLANAKNAFVFLGATGDNALRPSGVWSGLYEAFSGGVFNKDSVGIHIAMNTPHTLASLTKDVVTSLTPLYAELKTNSGWMCKAKDGDCSPQRLLQHVVVNIWKGRDANAQAANMSASLTEYDRITVYLSVPPFAFGSWAKAAVDNWGKGTKLKVHVAAEKPFGTSLAVANTLHQSIVQAGVPESNLHLVDHWLSFFMIRHLPDFRSIVKAHLGLDFSNKDIKQVVVTEYEDRALAGRGEFFDSVGQVRDMVQSHLLQVLALVLVDPSASSLSEAKLAVLNQTTLGACKLAQYDGWLLEPKLKYHPRFADSTYCQLHFKVAMDAWKGVDFIIQTGKEMGTTLYRVEIHEKSGAGVLVYDIGKEEQGTGAISVQNWKLTNSSAFQAPSPGFFETDTVTMKPSVNASGFGTILDYSDPNMYFPKPYAMMAAALLTANYGEAFVTYPECQRSWEIINATSSQNCLDPAPANVAVYKPPQACNHTPPTVCWQADTVTDLYDKTFKCTPVNDKTYVNISLYQAKCHTTFLV